MIYIIITFYDINLCNALPLKYWLGLNPNAARKTYLANDRVFRHVVIPYCQMPCSSLCNYYVCNFPGKHLVVCLFPRVHFSYIFAIPLICPCRYNNVSFASNWFTTLKGMVYQSIKAKKHYFVITLTWLASLRVACGQEITAMYLNYMYCKCM